MNISEKDRLDLRQEFERVFANKRLAEIAMEAMPPIDYDRLATKDDVALLGNELRRELKHEITAVRSEIVGVRMEIVSTGRQLMAAQLATMVMLGGWVAAIT